MVSIDEAWDDFLSDDLINNNNYNVNANMNPFINVIPKPSPLYISTKTKIVFVEIGNTLIDLNTLFWNIKIIDYNLPLVGIIKKQFKFTSSEQSSIDQINLNLDKERVTSQNILIDINNHEMFKHVQKINVGVSKKDILSFRLKPKSAFYNCLAFVVRIQEENTFKEIHMKLFNTGKIEVPGIQKDDTLYNALDILFTNIQPHVKIRCCYKKDNIDTVLINSNFNCGYFIKREILFRILINKYNIISVYDPCSYPGIQSKFYYNKNKTVQNGRCECATRCKKNGNCHQISFMIFRTGSVLIVGYCTELVIEEIYKFIIKIFNTHFNDIQNGLYRPNKKKNTRLIKKKS